MADAVHVELEFTPNPDSLKYRVNRSLLAHGAKNFSSREDAAGKSKLAEKLFDVPGVTNVMLGTNFVSVNFSDQNDIHEKNESLQTTLKAFLESGEAVLEANASSASEAPLTETEKKIIEFLDQEVRPAVAMDGGDIAFEKYEDGYVFLRMQGSCSGCPSSMMTLKMGVENRLKEVVPEVKEVIPV